jgi:hypothetical protein
MNTPSEVSGGTFGNKQYTDIVEDLIDARTGEIIPKKYSVQIPGIPKLKFDWSKIVERDGTCMGCHQNMTDKKLWEKVSEKGKLNTKEHIELMNKMIKYMAEKAQKGKDW